MRTVSLVFAFAACAYAQGPALGEDLENVVAGLNYRMADPAAPAAVQIVQAVRVRRDTGQVLVRHRNGRTSWVDPSELEGYPQPVVTEPGPYLFVAGAVACLLDGERCGLRAAGGRASTLAGAPPSESSSAE